MKDTLITSISGIRGIFGRGLDPDVLVKYAGAFGTWCRKQANEVGSAPVVVVGRDARITGPLCARIVTATLQSTGCDVVDIGLATTPTVEMAVLAEKAVGGIVFSASHNPAEWNALKLLNGKGEFLSPQEAESLYGIADREAPSYAAFDKTGSLREEEYLDYHIDRILDLDFIDPAAIGSQHFSVVVDGVNSVGGVAVPALLERLGVEAGRIDLLNGKPTGRFAHEAEPLAENLTGLMEAVREKGADLGIAVDPDVDRLALVADGGDYLGEELTQVVAADFLWRFRPGPFVTNLSSSRAIEDVAARYGASVHRAAVGEINVVKKMQEVEAVLGGEGNGGVILPDLHYGRDALVGIAMTLQHLANEGASLSEVRSALPTYVISKNKLPLGNLDPDGLLAEMAERYRDEKISTIDGVKIDFEESWVHLRKSNTEPIIRVYAEAHTKEEADEAGRRFLKKLKQAQKAAEPA